MPRPPSSFIQDFLLLLFFFTASYKWRKIQSKQKAEQQKVNDLVQQSNTDIMGFHFTAFYSLGQNLKQQDAPGVTVRLQKGKRKKKGGEIASLTF